MFFGYLSEKTRSGWVALVLLAVIGLLAYNYGAPLLSGNEDSVQAAFIEHCTERRTEAQCTRMVESHHGACFRIAGEQRPGWSCGGYDREAYRECLITGPSMWRRRNSRQQTKAREQRRELGLDRRPGELR